MGKVRLGRHPAYLGPGLDVRPPVQEDLDDLQVASPCSIIQCSGSILSKNDPVTDPNILSVLLYGSTDVYNTAYITMCLDVGSSLAKQNHHIGVTVNSGYDQGGFSTLSETNTRTMTALSFHFRSWRRAAVKPQRETILLGTILHILTILGPYITTSCNIHVETRSRSI